MTTYLCDYAWLTGGLARDVRLDVAGDRIRGIEAGATPDGTERRLHGVTFPGIANTHSHAFHRALRGRTQSHGGSFWTWREEMYPIAGALNPENYLALARATYAEMALAGITVVGEFHYVHHRPGGKPFGDPNAMGAALVQAASDAGVRLTLLDVCYLHGGLTGEGHIPLSNEQLRFGDGSVAAWAERMRARVDTPMVRMGAAIHSVRGVARDELAAVAEASQGLPLHVHLSEQHAENLATQVFYGQSPTELLASTGVLGPQTTAIHATHLSEKDIDLLGESGTGVCFCPTTERDLADGIGPARALHDVGSPISLGTDQHAIIDPFEEMRGLEMHERLESHERGRFSPADLVLSASHNGYQALGWQGGGHLATGALADFITVRLDSVQTAGCDPAQVMYAACAVDVQHVVVGGEQIVTDGRHRMGDVASVLAASIAAVRSA